MQLSQIFKNNISVSPMHFSICIELSFLCWSKYLFTVLSLALVSGSLHAQEDMPGSQDHPKLPRVTGTTIVAYDYSDFDEGRFVTSDKKKDRDIATPTGKRTRLMYLAPKDVSGLQVIKNYKAALEKLGKVNEIYACDPSKCSGLAKVVWAKNNRIPSSLNGSSHFYATFGYKDQRYFYSTVTTDDARYHISVYTAFLTGIQASAVKQKRSIHVEILEEADFKATLEVVTPGEITADIAQKGRIALYGIYFDSDSANLKQNSEPTLRSIADALEADPRLKIYVVGHTDNQGAYEYNIDLSKRRAVAVTSALASRYGIAESRLMPVGIGPVAPVASNKTEKGKSLNRRVELVAF